MKRTVLNMFLALLILAHVLSMPAASAEGKGMVRQILMLDNAFLVLHEDGTVVPVILDPDADFGYSEYYLFADGAKEISGWTDITQLACCKSFVAGLRADGSVTVAQLDGKSSAVRRAVGEWENIASLSSGYRYIAALCKDGTIRMAGEEPYYGEETSYFDEMDSWTDLVRLKIGVCAAGEYAVGLRSDGTILYHGIYDVGWSGPQDAIVDFDCSGWSLGAVREDGTVISNGEDSSMLRLPTHTWKDMKQVVCGDTKMFGLRRDGIVVETAWNESLLSFYTEQTALTDVQRIELEMYNYFAAYRSDGSVVIQYSVLDGATLKQTASWKDVVQVYVSSYNDVGFALGLKSDGTVLSAGMDYDRLYRDAVQMYS